LDFLYPGTAGNHRKQLRTIIAMKWRIIETEYAWKTERKSGRL
jgi:hypothetical protein